MKTNYPRYFDKYGKPINDLMEWAKLHSNFEYKRISFTKLWWGGNVSTVWLGLDHQFGKGPPLIFETMVFGWRSRGGDLGMDRYSGLVDARNGHIRMVKK